MNWLGRLTPTLSLLMMMTVVPASPAVAFDVLEFFRIGPSATINYRLTLVYDKDGVEYRGSGVIAAKYDVGEIQLPNVPRTKFGWRGEALGIDVPGVGRVFALVIRPRRYTPSIISDACGLGSPYDVGVEEWLRRLREEFTGVCQVPRAALPFFAIFGDPSDLTSVRVLTADTLPDGLLVKSATIERTGDQPTYGTTDILTWLDTSMRPLMEPVSGQFLQDGKWKTGYHYIGPSTFRDGAS